MIENNLPCSMIFSASSTRRNILDLVTIRIVKHIEMVDDVDVKKIEFAISRKLFTSRTKNIQFRIKMTKKVVNDINDFLLERL